MGGGPTRNQDGGIGARDPQGLQHPQDPRNHSTAATTEDTMPGILRGLSPEDQAQRMRKRSENGLLYADVFCARCRRHLGRQATIMGEYEIRCPNCKKLNVVTSNRVGEADLRAHQAGEDPYAPILPPGHRLSDKTPVHRPDRDVS